MPMKFSKKTVEAMEKGMITRAVRTEVINAVAVQVLKHKTYPTSEEYTEVCRKLIEAYAALIGNGYVSPSYGGGYL